MPKILENTREDYKDFFDNDLSKSDPELYNSIKPVSYTHLRAHET